MKSIEKITHNEENRQSITIVCNIHREDFDLFICEMHANRNGFMREAMRVRARNLTLTLVFCARCALDDVWYTSKNVTLNGKILQTTKQYHVCRPRNTL